MKSSIKPWLIILALLGLMLTGCSSLVKAEQPEKTGLISLSAGSSLGQTFMARYAGLSEVLVYLEPEKGGDGEVLLQVKTDSQSPSSLRAASLPVSQVKKPGLYPFNFASMGLSTLQDYYFRLTIKGGGSIKAGVANPETYLNGAVYLNEVPQEAQTTFLLGYDRLEAALGLAKEGLTWLLWLAVGAFLFILPGWALGNMLWPGWTDLHWAERTGLASGASLVIYPIFVLWTDVIGLHLGPLYAWLPPISALLILLWCGRQKWRKIFQTRGMLRQQLKQHLLPFPWADLALVIAIGLTFVTRFWAIRNLEVPMWGDSYQHTLIAQLIVDNKGLFESWLPYADLQTMTYHFGFHSLAAAFHWVTGLSMPLAVLWTGQIINGLAVLALFPLARRVNANFWAGAIVILLAGLCFPTPMVYVNWGRYTQLAGQVILPAAICVTWQLGETKGRPWRLTLAGWIIFCGLALTHYRVLIFGILFLLALGANKLIARQVRAFWWHSLALGIGTFILFLPWLITVSKGSIPEYARGFLTTPASQLSPSIQGLGAVENMDFSLDLPTLAWLALPIAIGWGFWRREINFSFVSAWWLLVLMASAPQWLGLPGGELIKAFTAWIAIYIPASLLIGTVLGWIIDALLKQRISNRSNPITRMTPQFLSMFLCILILAAGVWGARQRLWDVNPPKHALVTHPDIRAAEWIKSNVPDGGTFFVNSFFAFDNLAIVGGDAGWWLPLLAERQTMLPPLSYSWEKGPISNYQFWINALLENIQQNGINNPETLRLLDERNIKYIYIGQQQGRVNNQGPVIEVSQLLNNQFFEPIYHQDRVWIFRIFTAEQ